MITDLSTDEAVLDELATRLRRARIRRELTQRELAREAGVSVDTVKRLESGRPIGTDNLVRALRALGLLGALDSAIPRPQPSPIERRDLAGRERQRVRHASAGKSTDGGGWSWGEAPGES